MSEVQGNYGQEVGLQEPKQWERIHHQVIEGLIKPSKAYVELRAMESEIAEIKKVVETELVTEILSNGQEPTTYGGFEIKHMNGRSSYNYKECSMWADADNERKRVQALVQMATQEGVEITDQETGEVIEPVTVKQGNGFIKMEKAK